MKPHIFNQSLRQSTKDMVFKMEKWLKQLRSNIKTIFGLPNYERYLDHHRRKHPNEPVMSEKEFYLHALKERYESGKINRCC